MRRYDPLATPNPQEWLALDEQKRIDLARDYHRRANIDLPNDTVHAVLHAVVETQVALGDEISVERTLRRLMSEGLDRHEAVHAIGSVLAEYLFDLSKGNVTGEDPNPAYMAKVEQLTAESWRTYWDEPEEFDSTTGQIDVSRVLEDLDIPEGLPRDAIRLANAHRDVMVPAFLQLIEQNLHGELTRPDALFFIFHLLGQWREKSAYRPLAKLLQRPRDEINVAFGGAITETAHRVMAAIFDKDPAPLYDLILDPEADEFIRSRMFDVLAMVTLRGELPRSEMERFLRDFYSAFESSDDGSFVWVGWQSAIAALGLVELKSLVQRAFELEYVDPSDTEYEFFEEDLQRALKFPDAPWERKDEYTLFGDTIEELSSRYAFSPEYLNRKKDRAAREERPSSPSVPAINPFKIVGRNDPCPCGSGKKFKKCCLSKSYTN
jgi:hypothetical protein